jgi:hypothetical protein
MWMQLVLTQKYVRLTISGAIGKQAPDLASGIS